jgi:hypothetical protein
VIRASQAGGRNKSIYLPPDRVRTGERDSRTMAS